MPSRNGMPSAHVIRAVDHELARLLVDDATTEAMRRVTLVMAAMDKTVAVRS